MIKIDKFIGKEQISIWVNGNEYLLVTCVTPTSTASLNDIILRGQGKRWRWRSTKHVKTIKKEREMAMFWEAPAGDPKVGEKIFKTKCA